MEHGDVKQKENESNKDYVARLEQTAKLNFIALMESIRNAKNKGKDGSKEKKGDKTHQRDRHRNSKVQRETSRDKDRLERRHRYLRSKAKEKYQDYKNNVKDGQRNRRRNPLRSPLQSKTFPFPLNNDMVREHSKEDPGTFLHSGQQSTCVHCMNGYCEYK